MNYQVHIVFENLTAHFKDFGIDRRVVLRHHFLHEYSTTVEYYFQIVSSQNQPTVSHL
jgi:hypothetical protein